MKSKITKMMPIIIGVIIGGLGGYFGIRLEKHSGISGDQIGTSLIILGISLYAAMYIHIIVHEAGHLIAGKISGYAFVSFRIMKFMWMKKDGKLQFKRYMLAGTGGQCLMMPPKDNAYDYPCVLYNLGGVISNLVVSGLCMLLYLLLPGQMEIRSFLMIMCLIGILYALINGIPLQIGGINNDGRNILHLRKNRDAHYALWVQLYINYLLTEGQSLKDIEEKYFETPQDADLKDPIVCAISVYKCNYLHSQKQFDKAKQLTYDLFENAPGLLGIYKNELNCELLFYEMMDQCRKEEVDRMYTKELKKYIQLTASYVSRRRLLYAYEILVNKDLDAAKKQYEAFEKAAVYYPFAGETKDERELIVLINEKAAKESILEIAL